MSRHYSVVIYIFVLWTPQMIVNKFVMNCFELFNGLKIFYFHLMVFIYFCIWSSSSLVMVITSHKNRTIMEQWKTETDPTAWSLLSDLFYNSRCHKMFFGLNHWPYFTFLPTRVWDHFLIQSNPLSQWNKTINNIAQR